MTAAEAIASMREDIDRLAAKALVKPGYIARKRAEVAAIERELSSMQGQVDHAEFAVADAELRNAETDLRLGMLANVLIILGFDPMVHLRRPLSDNPDVYHDAAAFVHNLRNEAGLVRRSKNYTTWQLKELLANALWSARLCRRLTPHTSLDAKEALHATTE